ncbi:hypothetical protein IJ182_00735 [bacterium]|nr:hypothetical protein [bacterium]
MIDRIQTTKIEPQKVKHNNEDLSFKGPGTMALTGLRVLNNSPAVGACAVDLCSMVIPRTTIEWKNRGPQSGIETLVREGSSNLIHTCVGLIGLGAATLLSKKFNNTFGVKAQNIFASSNTIDNMAALWNGAQGNQKEFFEGFVDNLRGLNGNSWRTVSDGAKSEIVDSMVSLADKAKEMAAATGAEKKQLAKEVKGLKSLISAKVIKDTGAQASYKFKAGEATKELSASFPDLLDNAVSLSNSFATQAKEKLPTFIDSLKKNKTASTLLGMGICAALCISVQPVNRLLTKLRTGSDGFVGVDNSDKKEEKTSDGKKKPQFYKAAKTALGIAFPIAALRTIGKPQDLVSNIQFNSKVPTLNQFKFLYGLTIASRFLSARDGNELRESVIKDSLGFTNWLILGGMVSKLAARGLGGKELINNPIAQDGTKKGIKYAFKWLTQASVKTYDEILLPKAKELTSGEGKLLNFSELMKNVDAATKKKIRTIGIAQVAGYLYSGIVLGVGISKLNIFITKTLNARKKARDNMNDKVADNSAIKKATDYISQYKEQLSPVFKDFN